jgi:hypothetical protein
MIQRPYSNIAISCYKKLSSIRKYAASSKKMLTTNYGEQQSPCKCRLNVTDATLQGASGCEVVLVTPQLYGALFNSEAIVVQLI